MDRKQFIKTAVSGAFWVHVSQKTAMVSSFSIYSEQELTGKGKIPLVGDGFLLRAEPAKQFSLMKKAALKEGINLYVVSGFRSYNHQNRIWKAKYEKYRAKGFSGQKAIKKIIEYSTIPGTSRHHWGTDLDIIDIEKPMVDDPLRARLFQKGGIYEGLNRWLTQNANHYGFYQVYTDDPNRKGFKYEPWHFSYRPLSRLMLKEYLKLEIKAILHKDKIYGSEYFTDQFIEHYKSENLLGINKKLL